MEDWCDMAYSETSREFRIMPYCLFLTSHLNGIILELNSAFRNEDLVPIELTYGTERYVL
jgi:hypothetical protein